MKYYTDSRLQFERQDDRRYTRDAKQFTSKGGAPRYTSPFDSLHNDCCVYRGSRGCACALSTDMTQPHTTDGHGGIDDD
jgi:hypothetical protein